MNKTYFLNSEGDSFFKRNSTAFENQNYLDNDIIMKNIKNNNILNYKENLNILEIGCSNGWRLNELYNLNSNHNYYGIDPSKDAIMNGSKKYDHINFEISTCDNMSFEKNTFDLIMVPFVLMYVDRELLLKSVSEIDRILKNNGILIITDFYSNRQRKNNYKYIENTYIYKQNFFEIFLSSKNYFLNKLECFHHNTTNDKDNYDDTCYYVELKKDTMNLFT
jgi:ubiquinone/menaquinone biosynthesis C-methylase UbiE